MFSFYFGFKQLPSVKTAVFNKGSSLLVFILFFSREVAHLISLVGY